MELTPHSALPPGDANSNVDINAASALTAKERQALDRLIGSGEFHRSPNLEKILKYLCQQYFLGQGNLVKEYSVATEALDRRDDFDPKRDSIVRVEMHRLRRRLKEYYASRGAKDLIRINIPEKSYIPEFSAGPNDSIQGEVAPVSHTNSISASPSFWAKLQGQHPSTLPILLSFVGVAGLLAVVLWLALTNNEPSFAGSTPSASPTVALASSVETRPQSWPTAGTEYRILAGHPKGRHPDRYGTIWQGDDFFVGGKPVAIESEVRARGLDTNLFANMREGDFQYEIPLNPGTYEVTLYFAETSYGEGNVYGGGESTRQFHVHINGRLELTNYDVLGDAHDPNTATARSFRNIHPAKDGKLHLRFEPSLVGKAFVNAIQVRPSVEGKIRPIRIVCRPHVYRDGSNDMWEADHFYRGGMQITRPTGAPSMKDPDLFRGERYGKFTYSIPVPPGKYQARLFFAEYWWGPDRPGLGGVGNRVFDVFCNFKPLLTNFDIFKRSPKDRFHVESFHGLEPNLESKLVFDFDPRSNNALLNAIEIADDDVVLPNH